MMNKTRVIVSIFAVITALACGGASSQESSDEQTKTQTPEKARNQRIKEQAQEVSTAMVRGDYAKVVDLTHPKIVELMGGRDAALSVMQDEMKGMPAGMRILEITVGEPRDFIQLETESYAIVPSRMRIMVPEGTLVGDGFMIAVSSDGGHNWKFVDSSGGASNPETLKMVFPKAAGKLRIPETKRPVLHRDR